MKANTKYYLGFTRTQLQNIPTEEGESIEQKIRKATANNEPLESIAPMIYTPKADGVLPETDIRTDRTDLALDALDKFQKSEVAKSKGIEGEASTEGEQETTYVTE